MFVDKDWLAARLDAGSSIESIAREVGRHPSTVSYWVRRHDLKSKHAPRHAPKGGIARDVLARFIDRGLSVRPMAEELDLSPTTVRHWLKRHDLATGRAERLRERLAARGDTVELTCIHHGRTQFVARPAGGFRCLRCRSEAVAKRRRKVKETLVAEAGGRCRLCGYDRSVAALHFHHLDPEAKRFHLGHGGWGRAIAVQRQEARKCVLLCANCHAEVEAGVTKVPIQSLPG
jgi:transposase-like protein